MIMTDEQKTILRELLKGHSNEKVAMALGCSPETVKKRLKEIYRGWHVQNRAELFLKMLRGTILQDFR